MVCKYFVPGQLDQLFPLAGFTGKALQSATSSSARATQMSHSLAFLAWLSISYVIM